MLRLRNDDNGKVYGKVWGEWAARSDLHGWPRVGAHEACAYCVRANDHLSCN
jgi:hypothetical protein